MPMSEEINEIKRKVTTTGWPKQIINLKIEGIRGLNNHQINFSNFPICAIVGENGTGKSTILEALSLAYKNEGIKSYFPSNFFPDTPWDNLTEVKITYQIKQGQEIKTQKITKPTTRWRGLDKRLLNNVFFFDLGRIQSIESLIGASKFTKRTVKELTSRSLLPQSINDISEVMNRKYLGGRYAKTSADNFKEVGVLKFNFGDVSQFHQGTGESIIFDLIAAIENIPDYSLVIIDEIESSLHPKAQRKFIRKLLYLARTKTLQIIFSTHSPYVLAELPPEARILLTRLNEGIEIFYGPTVDFCLSQIDDRLHYEMDIFVEDVNSKKIISEIIRLVNPNLLSKVRISSVGPADVVQMLETLYNSKKFPIKLIGIVDGDQTSRTNILKLPGMFSPEKQIVQDITQKNLFGKIKEIINIDEQKIKKEFDEVQLTQSPHQWIEILADKFNLSKDTLFDCLALIWVRNCVNKEKAIEIVESIRKRLIPFNYRGKAALKSFCAAQLNEFKQVNNY
jgi:predicted ATPase